MREDSYDGYRSWKRWDRLFDPQPHEIALFRQEFASIQLAGKHLLDVGFGSGALLAWARQEGATVAGTELQAELRAAASERGVTNATLLSELHQRFDIITIFDVLEHVPREEIPDLLSHVKRLAAPGCQIFIRVPNCQAAPGLLIQFGDPTHITMLSGPIIAQMLVRAGLLTLAIREAAELQAPTGPLRRLLRPLQQWARKLSKLAFRLTWSSGSTPLSMNVVVIAKVP